MKKQKVEKKKKTLTREILEWTLTIVVAVMIAIPIRAFGFELVRVDGELWITRWRMEKSCL